MEDVTQHPDQGSNQIISIEFLRSRKSAPMAKTFRLTSSERVLLRTLHPSKDSDSHIQSVLPYSLFIITGYQVTAEIL